MIIHKLHVEGYKMIGEPIQLEFPEKGRIGILGQNESGKSTLLESIAFILFGLGKGAGVAREDLVTWGKDKARLGMEFSSGDQRYLLVREISVSGGHRAKLIPIIDDRKDTQNTITNLTEIQKKIEEITGVDKDSFTKLVYIRQKDLDALKELYKSKREQLVNKVIGIEVFDQASSKVKEETSEIVGQLNENRPKLENVRINKEQYESKLTRRQSFENEVKDLKASFAGKKEAFEKAKKELDMYDWLSKFKSKNDLVNSKESELSGLESEDRRLKELEDQLSKYSSIVQMNEAIITNLQGLLPKYQGIETQISNIQRQIVDTQAKRDVLIKSSGLSDKEAEITTKGLTKKKGSQLRKTGLAALFGFISLFTVLINPLLVSVAIALFILASYFFIQYLRMDRLLSKATFVESTNLQLDGLKQKLKESSEQMDALRGQSGFNSSHQIMDELNSIFAIIKDQTGLETFDGLKAVRNRLEGEVEPIRNSKPEQRVKNLQNDIRQLKDELQELIKTKPEIPDGLSYDGTKHKNAEGVFENTRNEYNKVESDINAKKELIKELDTHLDALKPDFDLFPSLEKKVNELDSKANLLHMVDSELSETSKELRTKIIPQARYIINQMLPTLTDGRYSDFEITEDLKFKVYSVEAGDYKEREIFSGGTQDQFLIALRLAFTQSILDSRVMADKYSLLMDECISSSDEVRKQGIFEVLEAMKGTFTQIFIIAHEDISNFVDHHIVLARNPKGYTEIRSKSW